MAYKRVNIEEVKEEVLGPIEKKETKIEGKFYVYDSKFNIYAFCSDLESAEKMAEEIGGAVKEVK